MFTGHNIIDTEKGSFLYLKFNFNYEFGDFSTKDEKDFNIIHHVKEYLDKHHFQYETKKIFLVQNNIVTSVLLCSENKFKYLEFIDPFYYKNQKEYE